ncbi:MAG TPA: pyridoxamine 5'-phosphate oxidase family protein [Puia sp.]|nr:pyridoxamine 5'-phosphate oxidase family protein [Puia sp.]
MDAAFIYETMRKFHLAAVASTSDDHQPETAVVGIVVTADLEVVFDTVRSSRKYRNLMVHPKVALVIWKNEMTVQYEGEVRELEGPEDDHYREVYYSVFPDGRERTAKWEGLTHFVIRPRWIRYSNFEEPVRIEELRF